MAAPVAETQPTGESCARLPLLLALAALGWQCLAPWALSDAAWDLDRRSLTWALALVCLWPPWLCQGWHRCRQALPAGLITLLLCWGLTELCSAAFALQALPAWLGAPERGLGLLDLLAWAIVVIALSGVLAAPQQLRWLRHGLLLAAAALGLWLWIEALGQGWPQATRAAGPIGNPLQAAGLMAVALWLLLADPLARLARGDRPTGNPLLRGLLGCWLLSALWLTGGRAALLALVVVAALTWLYGSPPRLRLRRGLAVLVALLLLVGALSASRPASLQIRGHLWAAATSAAWQHEPLTRWDGGSDTQAHWRAWLGLGRDNLEPALTRYRDPALDGLQNRGYDVLADRSHNALLDRWLEGGWLAGGLGALAWLWLAALLLRAFHQQQLSSAVLGAWLVAWLDRCVGVPGAATDLLLALLTAGCIASLAPQTTASLRKLRVQHGARLLAGLVIALPPLLIVASLLAGAHLWLWRSANSPMQSGPAAELQCAERPLPGFARIALSQQPYSVLPLLRLDGHWLADCAWPAATAEHLISAAPTLPRAWLQRARLLLAQGEAQAAEAALWQSLARLGRQSEAARLAAYAEAAAVRPGSDAQPQARAAIEALWAVGPRLEDRAWWRTLGYLYALAGEQRLAIDAYRLALQDDPGDAASQRNLERLERAEGSEPSSQSQ